MAIGSWAGTRAHSCRFESNQGSTPDLDTKMPQKRTIHLPPADCSAHVLPVFTSHFSLPLPYLCLLFFLVLQLTQEPWTIQFLDPPTTFGLFRLTLPFLHLLSPHCSMHRYMYSVLGNKIRCIFLCLPGAARYFRLPRTSAMDCPPSLGLLHRW